MIYKIILHIMLSMIISYNIFTQSNTQATVRVNENDLKQVLLDQGLSSEPDDIASLWLWLDANDITTLHTTSACASQVASNNDRVGCWQDKSGNGFHFTQTAAANRPEFLIDTINATANAVNFIEPNDYFMERNLAAPDRLTNTDMTFFMVFRANVLNQKNNAALFSSANAANVNGSYEIDYKNTDTKFHHTARPSSGGTTVALFDSNVLDLKLYTWTYDFSDQEILTYVDGTQEGSSVLDMIRTEYMKLGVNRQGSTYGDAMISEVIIYDRKLTVCEINEVILYLSLKYDQSSFQPIPIPGGVDCNNLFFWLRTDVGTSTTTNGAAVSLWEDKAFSNGELGQAVANRQPIYRNNATDNINYHPVIDFDGVNDYLADASVMGTSTNRITMFIVAKEDTRKNNQLLALKKSTGLLNRVWVESPSALGGIVWSAGTGIIPNTITGIAPYAVGETSITRFINNQAGLNQSIYVNGNLNAVGLLGYNLAGLDSTVLGGITNFYDGKIPEVLIYGTTFTNTQINNIETYLAIKYDVTLTGHDYFDTDTNLIYDISNGYANGIFGVGLDLLTALDQPKSKSSNNNEAVAFELTTDISDKQFLISGHNGGSLARTTLNGDVNVLTRRWFANMTGDVGTVNIELNLANISANVAQAASNVKIYVANNPALNNAYAIQATSVIGGIAYFQGIPLYDKYYTFSAIP